MLRPLHVLTLCALGFASATAGEIHVEGDPLGVVVRLGDRLLGITPFVLNLPAGTYTFTIRPSAEGEDAVTTPVDVPKTPRTLRVNLSARRILPVEALTPPSGAHGDVLVPSDQPDTRTLLDDTPTGHA